jgi:hypothetical protein
VVLAIVIVLALVAAAAIGAIVVLLRRGFADHTVDPADPAIQAALITLAADATGRPRRFISVEVHNPIELAGTRGRIAGLAGSLVPGLTRRIVYDQIVKQMRALFVENGVVAEVHVHSVHHAPTPVLVRPTRPAAPAPSTASPHTMPLSVGVVDDIDESDIIDEIHDLDGGAADAASTVNLDEALLAAGAEDDQPPV